MHKFHVPINNLRILGIKKMQALYEGKAPCVVRGTNRRHLQTDYHYRVIRKHFNTSTYTVRPVSKSQRAAANPTISSSTNDISATNYTASGDVIINK
jgi:hypothetical protein